MTSTKLAKPANKAGEIRALLEKNKAQIALALPRHLTVDRMLRVALTAVQQTPRLLDCDQVSLFAAIIQAAQLGLDPDGTLGQAYLVPYWNKKRSVYEAQFIAGYRGLVTLARRSGELSTIEARAVYSEDEFKFRYGLNPILEHVPHEPTDPSKADLIAVYAIAHLRDGGIQWDVMRRHEVDRVRARSKAKDDGPWVTDFEAMARKTVVKRLCKLLPMSVEANKAIDLDDRAEIGLPQDLDTLPGVTTSDAEPTSRLEKLTAEITGVSEGPVGPLPADGPSGAPSGDLLGQES
jgi:recombination protein RecT